MAIPESVIIGVGGLGTAAVTRAGRLWAPLILRGLDHPCNVETEAAHVELASSHVGTRRPSRGKESHIHHVRDSGRLSLPLWRASSLSLREAGASKMLVVTFTLVIGIFLFPKTTERVWEGEPWSGTNLHSRVYQKMSL